MKKFLVILLVIALGTAGCVAVMSAVVNTGLKIACTASGGVACVDNIAKLMSLVFSKSDPTSACISRDKTQRLPVDRRIDENAPMEVAVGQASPYARVRLMELMTFGIMTNFGDPDQPGELGIGALQPGLPEYFKDVKAEDASKLSYTAKLLAEIYEKLIIESAPNDWRDSPANEAVRLISIVYANHPGFQQRFAQSDAKTKTDRTLAVYEQALDIMKAQNYSIDFANDNPVVSEGDPLGQRLFVGVSDPAVAQQIVSQYNIGGLFAASSSNGRVSDDLKAALPGLQAASPNGLLIATDQEYTDSVNSLGLADGKKASDLASMDDNAAKQAGSDMGKALAALGINMDFAPAVDLQITGPGMENNPISKYNRGISSDPAVVADKAGQFAIGMASEHVLPVAKHFPGHGNTTEDSHTALPTTPDLASLEASDLGPFRDLASQVGMQIMVGHLDVPGLTENGQPASASPAAYKYLRDNLKFQGLAITDELGGMVAAGSGSLTDKVATSLNAGADMALFNVTSFEEFKTVYDGLSGRVQTVEDPRIAQAKQTLGLGTVNAPNSGGDVASGVTSGGDVGNLDGAKVPEPMRSIMIQAAEAEDLDPNGYGPGFVAAIYLNENNGFPWAEKEIDDGEGENAYKDLSPDSPEWKRNVYGEDGIWAPNRGNFQGPGQFGTPAWAAYGRDGDGDGIKNVYSFADSMHAIAAYLKALGATAGDFDSFVNAARQYNSQVSWSPGGGHITNPGNRFDRVQDLYAYQAGQLAKALAGGDTNGQTVVNDCIKEQSDAVTLTTGISVNTTDERMKTIEFVKTLIGTPYSWGGGDYNGPTLGTRDGGVADRYGDYKKVGLDCNGMLEYAMAQVNQIYIPGASYLTYDATKGFSVSEEKAQPGDFAFFADPKVHHIGLYIGDGKMIDAPNSGDVVGIHEIHSHGDFIGFTDPFAWAAAGNGRR